MHDANPQPLEIGQIRLAPPAAEAVENGDLETLGSLQEPSADGRSDKPTASSHKQFHWWAATIWSKVSPSEISGRQPG